WPRNFIDAFVLDRLKKEGLTPSSEADRRILLRRLSFDLTGLPPTTADFDAFEADRSEKSYEAAVERLLDSAHYGEHMAMYWLDLVRYADTVGYHGDQDMSVSPYRDYVINAFNTNMPFNRFTLEQIAGDLLPNPTQDQLVASGYNKLGMMSAEGGVQPKEYLAKYAADRVRTASAVWMGATLGCAECHDHKFDPFTSVDFYRFAAFFADIKERGLYSGANRDGNWGPMVDVTDGELPKLLKPIDQKIAELQKLIDTSTPQLDAAQVAWERSLDVSVADWKVLETVSASALQGVQLKVLDDQSILASGPSTAKNTYRIKTKTPLDQVMGFRIEVLPDASLPKRGPGRAANGNFVLTEFRVQIPNSNGSESQAIALQNASATAEQKYAGDSTPYGLWNAASAIDKDVKGANWGWAILPEVGKPNELVVQVVDVIDSASEKQFEFVLEQNHNNGRHNLGRFRLSATSSSQPRAVGGVRTEPEAIQRILAVLPAKRTTAQKTKLATYYRTVVAPLLDSARKQLTASKAEKDKLTKQHTRTSLITVAVKPREMRVLPRGNWMDQSGDVVQPGVPHFLRQIRTDDRATRADLAAWFTAADNPLTARVFVNRLWKRFFGTGLSKVLDDLGAQGESPASAELLDTLAVEFVESGWDVKEMVKLIVMSSTYRQSSMPRAGLRDVDPYNRLLARQSRFRLDAELIRDNALAISGLLVRDIGGRSVKPYQPAGIYRHLNFPRRTYKQDSGPDQYRRGIYTHWQRQFLHPAMKAFDAPSREECTAERPRSNTPLAALVLLNDPTFIESARVFATTAIKDGGDEPPQRLVWMFRKALSRQPNAKESAVLQGLLVSSLARYRESPAEAEKLVSIGQSPVPDGLDKVELAAWTLVARVLFNMHEIITRN
ncbi:MAG: DUF1549 and DUF1553 domain-containing protein, partial [Pirellulaceae bacterium]